MLPPSLDPKLSVRHVKIIGNNRTKKSVFDHVLQAAYAGQTLSAVGQGIEQASTAMSDMRIFDSIHVMMDEVKGSPSQTDLTITVKEKNWWKVHVGAHTDGYEGTAETQASLLNAVGTAEQLTFSQTKGHVGSGATSLRLTKPYFMGLPCFLNAHVSDESLVYERFSSYTEQFRGGIASVTDFSGAHELKIHLGWRDIVPRRNPHVPTAFAASTSVIAEATPSMKSSVEYTYKEDTRDQPWTPTMGSLMQYKTEVAGLLGDVRFVKAELQSQRHYPIGPSIGQNPLLTLSVCSQLGGIKSYGTDKHRPARIMDRFFLGGPTTLRGFEHKGVGPRASPEDGGNLTGDALGGELSYNATVSLGFPFPIEILMLSGFRGHFFANAGNLTSWDRATQTGTWMKNLWDDTRTSVGVGLVWASPMGRLEANYSWVLRSLEQDRVQNGQLGISMTFS